MKLATQLTGQNVQNYIRETGIDPNHWYPLGWADRFKQGAAGQRERHWQADKPLQDRNAEPPQPSPLWTVVIRLPTVEATILLRHDIGLPNREAGNDLL